MSYIYNPTAPGVGSGTVITSGQTTVDFGAVPGKTDTTTVITGQSGILAGSMVNAYITLVATADHSADEHWVDPPIIMPGNIVAGVGFTIYAKVAPGMGVMNQTWYSLKETQDSAPLTYGLWTVNWEWY